MSSQSTEGKRHPKRGPPPLKNGICLDPYFFPFKKLFSLMKKIQFQVHIESIGFPLKRGETLETKVTPMVMKVVVGFRRSSLKLIL